MADEKRYFSVKDMFEQAVTRAKTDPRYEEYSKICELDYDLLCSTCKYDKLYRCEFDVVGEVTYGSSEGIYGDIFLSLIHISEPTRRQARSRMPSSA